MAGVMRSNGFKWALWGSWVWRAVGGACALSLLSNSLAIMITQESPCPFAAFNGRQVPTRPTNTTYRQT